MPKQKLQEIDHQHACGRTLVAQLKACAKLHDAETGGKIHALCIEKGLLRSNAFVGNALIHMYAKCGMLEKAQEVFDLLQIRDVVAWNALITGYVQHARNSKALDCFKQMKLQGVSCDAFTYSCMLKACGSIRDLHNGRCIHADIEREGLLQSNHRISNAPLYMYTQCSALSKAQEVFNMLPVRNVVAWTSLIAGYMQQERAIEALNYLEQMQIHGIPPDAVAIVCGLKACGSIAAKNKGRELHAYAESKGFLRDNILVGTALVDMYAKFGMLANAHEVFNELPDRNVVSWNSLIAGYAQQRHGEEALKCFERMKLECVSLDAATYTCSLKACGGMGAMEKGKELHSILEHQGLLETSQVAGNALVDMYAKSGVLTRAHKVFEKLPVRNTISWNALMTGYAQLGKCQDVLCIFARMRAEGIMASSVTFLSVLCACSHAGLVDKGETYFLAMSEDYSIIPSFEHYTCMVDLFGRAGQLERALILMKKTPSYTSLVMWLCVLGACRKWGNVELGRQAFEQAVRVHKKDSALYTSMSNIYADAGLWANAKGVNAMRVKNGAWK